MNLFFLFLAIAVTLPGIFMSWSHIGFGPLLDSITFGAGIFSAAFILSWAAEIAQMDISKGLALAILALIAILPEYAVDLYFAWVAAYDPIYISYASANMTGANRLLVGGGWSLIVFLFYFKFKNRGISLTSNNRAEISYLTIATLYAFTIPLKGSLNVIDFIILACIFAGYAWRTAIMEVHEPELVGPARLIARLPQQKRRIVNLSLFLFSGFAIYCCAEPFAEALIDSGKILGVDEYFLVQWLAPLASESPEFIIASLWTLRGQPTAALTALISSAVNQWTLLIGTLPVVYSISGGSIKSMLLDARQQQEILLTAALSLFAVTLLVKLHISWRETLLLFTIFISQLIYPDIRLEASVLCLLLALIFALRGRQHLKPLFLEGLLNRKP